MNKSTVLITLGPLLLLNGGCSSNHQTSEPPAGHISRLSAEPLVGRASRIRERVPTNTVPQNTERPRPSDASSQSSHKPLKQQATAALNSARTSLLTEKKVAVDVLWVLTQMQNRQHDAAIDRFIHTMKGRAWKPSYLPGVFPNLPKATLPESIQPGTRRFLTYLSAPRGQPQKTALRYVKQFISEKNATGYILTHQLIVFLLADQAGLPISPGMGESKQLLLNKIVREQMGMDTVDCVDLYMERVALILFYGSKNDIDRRAVDSWITTIAGMQLPDGSWPLSNINFPYNGEEISISSPRSHTTVLAMMALQAYLNNY